MTWQRPKRWASTRLRIIARDGGICYWDGLYGADSADHLTPLAFGGSSHDDNLVAAHRNCNSARGGAMKGPRAGLPRARASRWG